MSRPRIVTENEKHGPLDETGGTWLVWHRPSGHEPYVAYVATNRVAAEDALYAKAADHGGDLDPWSIEVWEAQTTYPSEGPGDWIERAP